MPNKPTTLREWEKEFDEKFPQLSENKKKKHPNGKLCRSFHVSDTYWELVDKKKSVKSFIEDLLTSHSTELISKYEVKFMFEKSGQCSSLHRAHPETEWEKGWNSAVEAMLKYLPQPSLEEYNQVINFINQEE